MFISPQEMGYSLPNVYMTYPKAQPRQVSQQKQVNVAMSREASRRGFRSVAEMQAAAQGGARPVSQKDKLEAARRQWAEKSQAEAQKRVAARKLSESKRAALQQNIASASGLVGDAASSLYGIAASSLTPTQDTMNAFIYAADPESAVEQHGVSRPQAMAYGIGDYLGGAVAGMVGGMPRGLQDAKWIADRNARFRRMPQGGNFF